MRIWKRIGRSRLTALGGCLVIASGLGTALRAQTTVLTLTPAAHNFGEVIVGALRVFTIIITVTPGAGPGDSVAATISAGPDQNDFILGSGRVQIPMGHCSGKCELDVVFSPRSLGIKAATLHVLDSRGGHARATLSGTAILGCTMYEGLCNYAPSYTGNFGWQSTVNTKFEGLSGVATVNVDVTVKDGVVLCRGTQSETVISKERKIESTGVISGPGLLVVEFKRIEGELRYLITAACPSAEITATTTNYNPNSTGTTTLSAKPANFSRRISMDPEPGSPPGIDLVGRQLVPHPDQDPDNGVTGTLAFAWSLNTRARP